jgi:subtilisin-like proprotein convertase family protein
MRSSLDRGYGWKSLLTGLGAVAAALFLVSQTGNARLAAQCGPNPIVCENLETGAPWTEWDVSGAGDTTLQGFATDISINKGDTVHFKVSTTAATFNVDIYRLGYYGGMGARKIASIANVAGVDQAPCLEDSTTNLVDCGNWTESASWPVPSTAVSGMYIAKLTRADTEGTSHIAFIVRDDASHSDLLMQTSDTTWQAYNQYGGFSLYTDPRATKVSYNRPFATRTNTPSNFFFYAEYPMVRWLESNGYDVTYSSGVDTDRRGALLTNHKVFVSVGHDEYWSGAQRANVEAARGAGVNLAFFSGNEVYWKTRWEPSNDGTATPYRTLVTYKETHANDKTDPAGAAMWTGTWRDPRFSPPADGGRPENALTGQLTTAIKGSGAITVPSTFAPLRFWRNTAVAQLTTGAATLAADTVGYEWDEDLDNGSRPAGLIPLSLTSVAVSQRLIDFGTNVAAGNATHTLTMYRHASGALVFGAGTVQWAWGLDTEHDTNPDLGAATPDATMRQATINLLADMGTQPATLESGMVAATASADTTAPSSAILAPTGGASLAAEAPVTITGTASDGGGVVGAVEVSVDGGATWHRATGGDNWSYAWRPSALGTVNLKSRAVDDSGNIETSGAGVSVTVTAAVCPCTLWDGATQPLQVDVNDNGAIEVGVKFRADRAGQVSGVRFYKGAANTGTHVGHLWNSSGTLLATATFANETASGWQDVTFASPVTIAANTTYVASYHSDVGHYSLDPYYFGQAGVDQTPLHALKNGVDGVNGVFAYNANAAFPNQSFQASNYWVDVVFESLAPDTTPPTTTSLLPAPGAIGAGINTNGAEVSIGASVTVTFNEAMDASTISSGTFILRDPGLNLVPSTVSYNAATNVATLTPTTPLAAVTTYTATITGGSGGAKDAAGNALASSAVWSFTTADAPTCPCTIWSASEPTSIPASASDQQAVELGVKFVADVNGTISGIRFYKASTDLGTHTAALWTRTGTLLASASFTGESSAGWQEVSFATPIAIAASTTYVASYHTSFGNYSVTNAYFTGPGANTPPLHALPNGFDGPNAVYKYGATGFPTLDSGGNNYWVDVVFDPLPPDAVPPTLTGFTPGTGATGVDSTARAIATFSEAMLSSTITSSTFVLRDQSNAVVASTLAYDAATHVATLTPNAPLAASTTYTATITGGGSGIKDIAGNAIAGTIVRSFTTGTGDPTCPCSIWDGSATPGGAANDTNPTELGVRFRSDLGGTITGVRFYKDIANVGTHTGTLWSNDGTELATGTFPNETASGWQQLIFATPVTISANTTYVASYHTTVGKYNVDSFTFNSAVVRAPLRAMADNHPSEPNGVYKYGTGAFPTDTFNNSNYWIDVVFEIPGQVTPTTAINVAATPPAVFGTAMEATVSVLNSPGAPGDLLALYAVGTPDSGTRIDWKYLNGLQTSPAAGVTSATVTFMMPTATGSYEVRLFPSGSSTHVATSTAIVVGTAPAITGQPSSAFVITGQQAQLAVTASGTGAFSYQWYLGNSGTTTSPVAGATLGTLTTPALTNPAYSYWVRVSTPWGIVDSNTAVLSVGTAATISTQPVATTFAVSGQQVPLTVTAAGSPSFTYQWYQGTTGVTDTPVAGATLSSFTTPPLSSSTNYWVRISNSWATVSSSTAVVTVGSVPAITTQPANAFLVSGQAAQLSVTATGTALTYQWYEGASGDTASPVGTNANTFTSPALTGTKSYWVHVSSSWGTVNSTAAVASIGTLPVVTSQPADSFLTSGQQAGFTVAAAGSGTLTYQWYRGNSGTIASPVLSGGTSNALTTSALSATTSFWVRVSSSWGHVDSNTATASIGAPPTISTQPASAAILALQPGHLSVGAAGTTPFTYQWYVGSAPSGSPISGETSSLFTTPALTNTTSYWVRVTNPWGSADSDTAVLSTPPAITTANPWPAATAGSGYALTLQAINSRTPYQWAAVTALPAGLVLNGGTGAITGTPNTPGTVNVTIRVTGADNVPAEQTFSLAVGTAADPLSQWHLDDKAVEIASANVRPIWSTTRGAGVVIGIVDDGLQGTHPDLQANYNAALSHDFNGNDGDPSPATSGSCSTAASANCEGTSAAGIAAARSDNGLGGAGVAPLASLAGLRLTAAAATDAQEAAAFGYEPQAIAIENNSWHRPDNGQTLSTPGTLAAAALETAATQGRGGKGRIFVFAAGDGRAASDNCNFDGYANSRFGIAVGAVDGQGLQAPYSESCSALLVSAPSSGVGGGLTTTDLVGSAGSDATDYTTTFGGTAAAAPVVSGVTALMLARNPLLTWRDVQHILVRTSRKVNANDGSWTAGLFPHSEKFGFGVVDAAAAVNMAETWTNVAAESKIADAVHAALALAIPHNNISGVSDDIVVGAEHTNFKIEHVEVEFSATHPRRGDLEITLTSPNGTVSRLATPRPGDSTANFTQWKFRSVRHWGETAGGRWTLKVVDTASGAGSNGTFTSWTLRIYGESGPPPAAPAPPPPPPAASSSSGSPAPTPDPPIVPKAPQGPGAPGGLVASVFGSTVVLTWSAPGSGTAPTTYILEAGSAPGASDAIVYDTGSASTSYTAFGVGVGTYYVRIRAANGSGTSAASNEAIAVVGSGAPPSGLAAAPPTGLVTSAIGSGITLAWNRSPAGGAPTYYVVEAGSAPGRSDLANFSTGSAVPSFSASGIGAGTYFVRVRAGNAVGISAASNEATLVVGAGGSGSCSSGPGSPSGLQAVVNGSNVTLGWFAAAGGPTSYVLEAGSFPGAADLAVSDTGSTATTLTATNVGGGTYFVRVRARNACGSGGASNEVTVIVR